MAENKQSDNETYLRQLKWGGVLEKNRKWKKGMTGGRICCKNTEGGPQVLKSLNLPFDNPETATLYYEVLKVDKDYKGSKVRKEIINQGTTLLVNFYSSDLKILRVAFNSFMKNTILVAKTVKDFPITN